MRQWQRLMEPLFGTHNPLTLESYRAYGEQVLQKAVAEIIAVAAPQECAGIIGCIRKDRELDPALPPSSQLEADLQNEEFKEKYLNSGIFERSLRSMLLTEQLRKKIGPEVVRMLKEAHLSDIPIFVLDKPGGDPIYIGAECLSGKESIYVRASALPLLNNDEVIAIIGHEIGHKKAGHKIDGYTRPRQEYEADHIGARLSRRPAALISALRKLEAHIDEQNQETIDKRIPPLLAGSRGSWRRHLTEGVLRMGTEWMFCRHPNTEYRIHRLEKEFAEELGLSFHTHRMTTNSTAHHTRS